MSNNTAMQRVFVSIGSNIDPKANIIRILYKFLEQFKQIDVSRIIETAPVGVITRRNFLNCSACINTDENPDHLKRQFSQIETALGRNRDDQNRKQISRPADLDILFCVGEGQRSINHLLIPTESYVRPTLIELLHYLDIKCPVNMPPLPKGVEIPVADMTVGRSPIHLSRSDDPNPISTNGSLL